ncbi:MAG: peptidyl-prolyl cis-trans isomerase, partial [Rhodothalassiaceae bacterium]
QAAYEARLAEFQVPELRDLDMVTFDLKDKEKADRFVARVRAGEDFDAVLADMTDFKPDDVALGDQSRTDLEQEYNPRVADAVFKAAEGNITDPVQSVFGWHVFRIKSITPANERSLAQVAPTLRQDVAKEKAYDAIYDMSVKAEEALTRGAGVEEIAQTLGLDLVRATVSRDGHLKDGGTAPAAVTAHLSRIWQVAVDEPPTLEESGDNGFIILDVTAEIPPEQRPFEEVADLVRANLLSERKLKAAGERADRIAERIRNGESPDAVARALGLTVLAVRGVIRDEIGRASKVAPVVGRLIFELEKPGAVDVERAATGGGYVVVRLESVTPGDPARAPAAYDRLRTETGEALVQDALLQYQRDLLAAMGVEINNARFQQLVNPQGSF